MIRKIITCPHPTLKLIAKPIEKVDPEIKRLLDDMAETMYAGDGVGLAAPQVDVSLRAIVIDVGEGGPGLLKMVNPNIVEKEGEFEWEEGCLSVPEFRIKVKRSEKVKVEYLNESGEKKLRSCEKLLSVAVQHEIDHLDGKLIIDCASRLKQDLYFRKVEKMKKNLVL
jgi:peptide deformylase